MAGKGTGFRALDWAWGLTLSPTQKLVLLNLAGRVDQAYSCYPSLRTIADETGLNRATVARVLAGLESGDVLLRASRQRPNGSATSNRYYLNHPDAPHVTGEVDDDADGAMIAELDQAARRATGTL